MARKATKLYLFTLSSCSSFAPRVGRLLRWEDEKKVGHEIYQELEQGHALMKHNGS